jgi:hypothetical protein
VRSPRRNPFNLLDLVVEIGQQILVRAGEPRTWVWPGSGVDASTER